MQAATTSALLIKGKPTSAPSLLVDDRMIVCEGSWLRTARIFDEVWLATPPTVSPAAMIERVEQSDLHADLFTFSQPLPDVTPRYCYHFDCDSLAIAPTTDFKAWWESLPHESRKNVRKAQKRGVTVGPVEFTDELVAGIKGIYDETPVRQGRRFWHYGKDLATIKRENSSYLERSQFVGATLDGQLIGFIKMVYTGSSARIMQILSMNAHFDKHITNALLASAMELCSQKPVARLIYGQYIYGNKASSSVTEFKRRNGFQEALVPRYYVPLTLKGRVALASGTHRGLTGLIPEPVLNVALKARMIALRPLSSRVVVKSKSRAAS